MVLTTSTVYMSGTYNRKDFCTDTYQVLLSYTASPSITVAKGIPVRLFTLPPTGQYDTQLHSLTS